MIIMGTSLLGKLSGMVVPSSEQKQSGSTHTAGSHGGARFGSLSISVNPKEKKKNETVQKKIVKQNSKISFKVIVKTICYQNVAKIFNDGIRHLIIYEFFG